MMGFMILLERRTIPVLCNQPRYIQIGALKFPQLLLRTRGILHNQPRYIRIGVLKFPQLPLQTCGINRKFLQQTK